MGVREAAAVLVEEGVVTRAQFDEALALRGNGDRREVPELLVALGHASEDELARALAARLRLDFVDLAETDVEAGAAGIVDREVLRRHRALPIRVESGNLVVAMRDPANLYAIEDLAMLSGHRIRPVVATGSGIERVSKAVFAAAGGACDGSPEADRGAAGEGGDALELGFVSVGDGPVVRLVGSILERALGEGASDVHVEPRAGETRVRYRVDGVLRRMTSVPASLHGGVVARIKVLADLDIAERRAPQDGRLSVKLGSSRADLRVATLPTIFGEKVVLRLLDTANVEVDLQSLGFEAGMLRRYERVFRRPYGTILVTGPTGCGKSTTLYATLGELDGAEKNIVTVEDPVEYRMPGVNQVQVNPKVGLGFASGLRSILRSDPDVVMIGEIRDRETARTSVEAALTGHLVLATLHTNDAPSAVARLTDMGVEPFLTASAVDCVIAQRLARRLCEHCKRPSQVEDEVLRELGLPDLTGADFCEPVGCRRCGGMGYRGRIGVYEMMVLDASLRDLVLRRVPAGELGRVAEAGAWFVSERMAC
ncbi:type II secretion system protein GspE [Rubrobacter tropicus]|uniref:Type II secretion system protein GspE n=1 Tax=Rubrobacter tropicus TaxID=2653851 RepID=A0A6G8Q8V8_9ACTN|nr:ATPase, T2SS/T4P/T4SS family [Rubrobacter tropicus]QIN82924.1 type II secretion system protein GspE [Rubrobacter tropicus]